MTLLKTLYICVQNEGDKDEKYFDTRRTVGEFADAEKKRVVGQYELVAMFDVSMDVVIAKKG